MFLESFIGELKACFALIYIVNGDMLVQYRVYIDTKR